MPGTQLPQPWTWRVHILLVFCSVYSKFATSYTQADLPVRTLAVNQIYYFAADTPRFGIELWRSDGTQEGTSIVLDINNGTKSSDPTHFYNYKNKIFLSAQTKHHGRELWFSDGTKEGTRLVMDICPGERGSDPADFTTFNDRLYFSANDCVHGRELWVLFYNSTAAGVVNPAPTCKLYSDIIPGPDGSNPSNFGVLVKAGDGTTSDPRIEYKMYFAANYTGASGSKPPASVIIATVNSSSNRSTTTTTVTATMPPTISPTIQVNITEYGVELWETTGTDRRNATVMTEDINIGPGSSNPGKSIWYWDKLYFPATKSDGTMELFRVWKCVPYRYMVNNILREVICDDFRLETVTAASASPNFRGVFQLTVFDDIFYFAIETEDSVVLYSMNKKVEPYEKNNGFVVIPDLSNQEMFPESDEFSFEIVDAVLGGPDKVYQGQKIRTFFGKSSYPQNFALVWLSKLATGEQFAENPDKNLVIE